MYRGVGADFEKPKKYLRLIMNAGYALGLKAEQPVGQARRATIGYLVYKSESFSIRTSERRAPTSELVLQRGSLPPEIALQGGKPRVQN